MTAKPTQDFASLLDELIASAGEETRIQVSAPSLRVDFLDQLERLQSNSPSLAGESAMSEYLEMSLAIDELAPRIGTPEVLPPVEPEAIAQELGKLSKLNEKQLAHLRREFAMRNHPDRVSGALRERAELRMRIANMMIDEAKSALTRRRR